MHTKKAAKEKIKDKTLPGNLIDWELQACQQGQTKGIPIGPDTSLAIAEFLLAVIDEALARKATIRGGVRFIDDIELAFARLADAEAATAALEALLNEYELQLNAGKTQIIKLPDALDATFVTQLRPHLPPTNGASRARWTDYFNKAFRLAADEPAAGVLRYALASLRGVTSQKTQWPLVQSLLWQCIALDPGTIRFVIDILWLHTNSGPQFNLDDEVAQNALESLIKTSAPVGHGSEVVWSLWSAMLFDLSLSNDALVAVSSMDDSFVAAASFLAHSVDVFDDPPNSPLWKDWFLEDCFQGPQWLFTYEAYCNGWMADSVKQAKLADDPTCKFLKDGGVSFVRKEAIADYKPQGAAIVIPSGGGGAGSV